MGEELKYKISLEDFFSKGLQSAEGTAKKFDHTVEGMDHHLQEIGHHMNDLKNEILAAVGVFELFKIGEQSAKEFIDAQKNAAMLAFTVSRRGGLAGDIEDLTEESEKLGKSSFFDHDEISKAQNSMLNYGISITQTKNSMKTLTDVALAKNKSMEDIISTIGMAASGGRAMGLKEYGLQYMKLEKDMSVAGAEARNFKKIIDAMGISFSGATESMQDMEFFKIKKIQDELKDFREEIGKYLMKAFDALLPTIKKVMAALSDLGHWLVKHGEAIKTIATAIGAMILAYEAYKGVMAAVEIGQNLLNSAMAMSPIGAMIVSVGLLTMGYLNLVKAMDGAKAHEDAKNDTSFNEGAAEEEGKRIEYKTKQLSESGKAANEEAAKYKAIIDDIAGLEKQMKSQMDMFNKDQNDFKFGQGGRDTMTLGLYNRYKVQLDYLKKLKAEIDNKGKKGEGIEGMDLGSGLSEPKASKLQNITINMGGLFANAKLQLPENLQGKPENFMMQLAEVLTSIVTDSAIVATE